MQQSHFTQKQLSALIACVGAAGFFATLQLLSPDPIPKPAPQRVTKQLPPPPQKAFGPEENSDEHACQLAVKTHIAGVNEDAILNLTLLGQNRAAFEWQAQTQNGTHRFVNLPVGHYALSVHTDEHALRSGIPFKCDKAEDRAFVDVDLSAKGQPLTLTVSGHEGFPPNTQVYIAQEDFAQSSLRGTARLTPLGQGKFGARLSPGTYKLYIRGDHHDQAERTLRVSDSPITSSVRLRWRPEATGTVVNAQGKPVPGALVYLGPNFDPKRRQTSVRSDPQGRFVLPIEMSRNMVLAARTEAGLGFQRLQRPTAQGFTDLKVTVKEGRTVRGTVTTLRGKAHAFGKVRYRVKELGLAGIVKTDHAGAFAIKAMPKHLDVDVWADESANGAFGGRVSSAEKHEPVRLMFMSPAYAQK